MLACTNNSLLYTQMWVWGVVYNSLGVGVNIFANILSEQNQPLYLWNATAVYYAQFCRLP